MVHSSYARIAVLIETLRVNAMVGRDLHEPVIADRRTLIETLNFIEKQIAMSPVPNVLPLGWAAISVRGPGRPFVEFASSGRRSDVEAHVLNARLQGEPGASVWHVVPIFVQSSDDFSHEVGRPGGMGGTALPQELWASP